MTNNNSNPLNVEIKSFKSPSVPTTFNCCYCPNARTVELESKPRANTPYWIIYPTNL